MLEKEITTKLAGYKLPFLERDLISAQAIKKLVVDEQTIILDISVGYPIKSLKNRIINELSALLSPLTLHRRLALSIHEKIETHTGLGDRQALSNVKNIIAVGSGKGGVGKSTVAVNLALALAKEANVGLLDADIYGPSQPTMLGAAKEKPVGDKTSLQPIIRHGVQSMSIGYLIDENLPMVWRGPMLAKALQQLLQDTKWDNLDYLIIDLPPGTGDIQLTLCQKIPLSGALIVTTPQDMALLDVRRACAMFKKLNVPLLGIIENMSHYHCTACGHVEHLFGKGGAEKLAKDFDVECLGALPLALEIRQETDLGMPPALKENNAIASLFQTLALKTAAKLSLQAKSYAAKFPKIVIAHDQSLGK